MLKTGDFFPFTRLLVFPSLCSLVYFCTSNRHSMGVFTALLLITAIEVCPARARNLVYCFFLSPLLNWQPPHSKHCSLVYTCLGSVFFFLSEKKGNSALMPHLYTWRVKTRHLRWHSLSRANWTTQSAEDVVEKTRISLAAHSSKERWTEGGAVNTRGSNPLC